MQQERPFGRHWVATVCFRPFLGAYSTSHILFLMRKEPAASSPDTPSRPFRFRASALWALSLMVPSVGRCMAPLSYLFWLWFCFADFYHIVVVVVLEIRWCFEFFTVFRLLVMCDVFRLFILSFSFKICFDVFVKHVKRLQKLTVHRMTVT